MTDLKTVWALLDTGADWNLLERDLIADDVPINEQLVNAGIGGQEPTNNHRVWLMLDPIGMCHGTGIVGRRPDPMNPYRMILGRKFLQCTRFIYDERTGHSLEWTGCEHAE